MSRLHLRAPSPALMVSMIALIVALGGTSYAAFTLPNNSVGTGQLRNKAVTTKKIRNGAVTRSKMNFRGVTVPNARTAANAIALGGHPASAYLFTGTSGQTLRIVGNAGQPSFQNGWTDLASGYAAASFYLDPIGRVHLQGTVKSGAANTTVFTLPTGYRPRNALAFAVAAGTSGPTLENVVVMSDGQVIAHGTATDGVSLDGVSFRVS